LAKVIVGAILHMASSWKDRSDLAILPTGAPGILAKGAVKRGFA